MNRYSLTHWGICFCLALVTMRIFIATSRAKLIWEPTACGEGGSWVEVNRYSTRDDGYPEQPENPYGYSTHFVSPSYQHAETEDAQEASVAEASGSYGCGPVDPELRPSILPVTGAPGLILPGAGILFVAGGYLRNRNRGKRISG